MASGLLENRCGEDKEKGVPGSTIKVHARLWGLSRQGAGPEVSAGEREERPAG
jgi:hypothetical protein